MKKFILLFFLTLGFIESKAQTQGVEMADKFYSEGKIYVVIGVLLIILLGIFGYLFFTERKLNRIEKQLNK